MSDWVEGDGPRYRSGSVGPWRVREVRGSWEVLRFVVGLGFWRCLGGSWFKVGPGFRRCLEGAWFKVGLPTVALPLLSKKQVTQCERKWRWLGRQAR
jgi:hypothetical protein